MFSHGLCINELCWSVTDIYWLNTWKFSIDKLKDKGELSQIWRRWFHVIDGASDFSSTFCWILLIIKQVIKCLHSCVKIFGWYILISYTFCWILLTKQVIKYLHSCVKVFGCQDISILDAKDEGKLSQIWTNFKS